MTLQCFHLRNDMWERTSDSTTPTYLASPYLYTIGTIGGKVRPFGDAHLVGKMGGLWAHPLRVLHGWSLAIETSDEAMALEAAIRCELYGSHVVREFHSGPLQIFWTEYAVDSVPALTSLIQVRNTSQTQWQGTLVLNADVDPHSAWFSDWKIEGTRISVENSSLLFSIQMAGSTHTFLVGTSTPMASWQMFSHGKALLKYRLSLLPAETQELTAFAIIAHRGGREAAVQIQEQLSGNEKKFLEDKIQIYHKIDQEVSLDSPSQILNRGWRVARLNLQLLASDYRPFMPPYLLAGLPEYPQLFGCDTTYTVPGALAAGFQSNVRSALLALAEVADNQNGQVPHEITTNGRVYNAGNTQETPQFVIAVWDYFRWTGDIDFLRELYPLCRRGMLEKLPKEFGLPDVPYLQGNGMVEVSGMADLKLDVQAYYLSGLEILERMANVLGEDKDTKEISVLLRNFASRFHSDWWLPAEELYADSMYRGGNTKLDGHWTVVVPIQLHLLQSDRARRSLQRIVSGWVNRWGMIHTRNQTNSVWTLPTGLLALATFAFGESKQGISLLENIAETSNHGLLGTLSELIPDGLCFIQLWSTGLLIQGIVEGLLGIGPEAYLHHVSISPNLPANWGDVQLTGLTIGQHVVDLKVNPSALFIRHREGTMPLNISYTLNNVSADFPLAVGEEKKVE